MNNKEVLEIKKRIKKESITVTRVAGCYVDADHNRVTTIGETFLNLDEEEMFKYMEILKKVFSGKVGNNILTLDIHDGGDGQKALLALKDTGLKDDSILDTFFNAVIDQYDHTGNYLILLFHDAYDIPVRTTDNRKLDESEEVYAYIVGAICPVNLSKPALGYREDENRIGSRLRDWVVGAPETGFVYPAFNDRSTDIHSLMFYTKDTKNPHSDFAEEVLGCTTKHTATEKQKIFEDIVSRAVPDEQKAEETYIRIQQTLLSDKEELATAGDEEEHTVDIQTILSDSSVDERISADIEKQYQKQFAGDPALVEQLLDEKTIKKNETRMQIRELSEDNEYIKELLHRAATELEKYCGPDMELLREIRKSIK